MWLLLLQDLVWMWVGWNVHGLVQSVRRYRKQKRQFDAEMVRMLRDTYKW